MTIPTVVPSERPAKNPKRAVILLSGGLDSTLAARMLVDQGIELFALHFTSPFCTCSRPKEGGEHAHAGGCHSQAQVVANELGIHIKTVSKGLDYIEIVRNPQHGRGSAINPCIDCRIYTLRLGREYMEEIGASFLVTGEVLGQRPMSQRDDTMRFIEKQAECDGIVLRPLTAGHMPPTVPEIEGWVDREKLRNIYGRGRREQIQMAADFGMSDYPCPAGGCLLTDKGFARKVHDLFKHKPEGAVDMLDLNLLKAGRHFRFTDGTKAIVAREEAGNRKLEAMAKGRHRVFRSSGDPGPSVAMDGTGDPMPYLSMIYTRYTKAGAPSPYKVVELMPDGSERAISVPAFDGDLKVLEDANIP